MDNKTKIDIKKLNSPEEAKEYLKEFTFQPAYQFDSIWEKVEKDTAHEKNIPFFNKRFAFRAIGLTFSLVFIVFAGFFAYYQINTGIKTDRLNRGRAYLVSMLSGDVYFLKKDWANWKKLSSADIIGAGDTVRTESNAKCGLQIIHKALTIMEGSTSLRLAELKSAEDMMDVRIDLNAGKILVKPNKLKNGEYFEIRSGISKISVVGTKFSVAKDADGNTRIAVSEGTVNVKPLLPELDKAMREGKISPDKDKRLYDALTSGEDIKAGEAGEVNQSNALSAAVALRPSALLKKEKLDDNDALELAGISESKIYPEAGKLSVLKIDSSPEDAAVLINHILCGRTPFEQKIALSNSVFIQVVKNRYAVYESAVNSGSPLNIRIDLKEDRNNKSIEEDFASQTPVLDKLPGELVWKKDFVFPVPDKEAVYDNGRIYLSAGNQFRIFSAGGSQLTCINALPDGAVLTKPVVRDNMAYLGCDMGGLYAYTSKGELVWHNTEAGQTWFNAAPVVYGGIIALPTIDKGLQLFSTNGRALMTIPLNKGEALYAAPLFTDNGKTLIFGNETGRISAYNLEKKAFIWKKNICNERLVFPLLGNDDAVIAVCRDKGCVISVNPQDGTVLWNKTFKELAKLTIDPIYTHNKILLIGENTGQDSILVQIDPKNPGKELKTTILGVISSASWNGDILYLGDKSGNVTAFDIGLNRIIWQYNTRTPVFVLASDMQSVYGFTSQGIVKIAR